MAGQPAPGSNPFLTFDVGALAAIDPSPPPLGAPADILTTSQNWEARARFQFAGSAAAWMVSLAIPWTMTIKAESLGPEPEVVLGSVAGKTKAGQLAYGQGPVGPDVPTLAVPAGALSPGVYTILAIVTFGGAPPAPIVGYNRDLVVQIYS